MKLIVGLDFGTSTTVVRYRLEGSDVVQKLEDNGKSVIPTLIFRWSSQDATDYGTAAENAMLLNTSGQKGECIQNFKMDLLAPQGSEKRLLAESYIEEFLSKHIFRLLGEATKGLVYNEMLVYVSYPSKWTTGMSDFMQEIVRKSIMSSHSGSGHNVAGGNCKVTVKGITEPLAAAHNFIHIRCKELVVAGVLRRGGAPVNVLMLDMGAGTSDITIFQLTVDENDIPHAVNVFSYPSVDNPSLCGGREIDESIRKYIFDHCKKCGVNLVAQNFRTIDAKRYKEAELSPCLNNGVDKCEFPSNLMWMQVLPNGIELLKTFKMNRTIFEAVTHDHWEELYRLVEAAMANYPHAKAEDIDLLCLTGGHSQWYTVENLFNGKGVYGSVGKEGSPDTHMHFKKLIEDNWRIGAIKDSFPQESVAAGMCYIGEKIVFEQCSTNNVWVQFAINNASSKLMKIVDAGRVVPFEKDVEFDLGVLKQSWDSEKRNDYRGYIKVYSGKDFAGSSYERRDLSYTAGLFATLFNVDYRVKASCKISVGDDNVINVSGNMYLEPTNPLFSTQTIKF